MKLKNKILLITLLLTIILAIAPFSNVKAAEDNMNLSIKFMRNSGYGYKVSHSSHAHTVWKIYNTVDDKWETIYCLKGGPGFGSENMDTGSLSTGAIAARDYTKHFDLKQPSTITPDKYKNALPKTDSNEYRALLWVLDHCYVAETKNASQAEKEQVKQNRKELLDAVYEYSSEGDNFELEDLTEEDYAKLTDDDIDVVQQLAIWHFTNQDDDGYKINEDGNFTLSLNSVQNTSTSGEKSLNDSVFTDGGTRQDACKALFQYLVNTAKENASTYNYASSSQTAPVKLASTTVIATTGEDGRIILGPYQLENVKDGIDFTLTGKVEANNEVVSDFKYLDENKENTVDDIKTLVGKTFYISLPEGTNIKNVKFSISGSFNTTTTTYWSVADAGAQDQPVVIVKKENIKFGNEVNYTQKIFDLSLRKFITAIGEEAPSKSRVPTIDPSEITALENGNKTTANKVHPKDPLTVKTGDIVEYTIRVYNEGEIAGYATEITDYLPDGLKLAEPSQTNQDYKWHASEDGRTITTDYLKDTLINAFDGDTLDFKDLKIECEVIATDSSQSLKNIAEITDDMDENKLKVEDRDSTPKNVDKQKYGETSQQDDDDFERLVLYKNSFDLSLRKFITAIDGKAPSDSRVPTISSSETTALENGDKTTANKVHPKNPLKVRTGSIVEYTIRVYNEGEVSGYATEITDYLPDGLKLAEGSQTNQTYKWKVNSDGKTITTDYLKDTLINAFDGNTLDYKDLKIECEVIATENTQSLKNIAEITADLNDKHQEVEDRDSTPENVDKQHYGETSQEDDDDFERLELQEANFDLSLRKFITEVQSGENVKKYDRAPQVDVTELAAGRSTTATYNHSKEPIGVSNGDIVTYTIRVYNEGEINGYVTEITDHLPAQLEFLVNDSLNVRYGWAVSSDGRTVKTTITSPNASNSANRDEIYSSRKTGEDKVLLERFNGTNLDYIDVQIRCKVKDDAKLYEKMTNIADVTGFTDENNKTIKDRDSQENNVQLPNDTDLPSYKDPEIERGDKYIPGQQDDDDFEKLVLQKFDLALRKFITGVNDKEITNRAPVFSKVSDTEYKYTHPKDPVDVANGNIVTYTLRIFNEGNISGYATKVKDDLPEGLEFLPDNEVNKTYRWKMYKEDGTETTDVAEAEYIETDYLSKEQENSDGDNLIKGFNQETMTMPDYRDVKIAFKVTEPNTSDRIITNIAEITDDRDENNEPVDDVDSTPDNDEPDEDDIDEEHVKVKYFDLSLKKWVSEAIVTNNGKTTVTKTGHTGDENPEPPVKVEIRATQMNKTIVKFKFVIKVTNEGEIAGYAKELIDYIPEGLKFDAKDNPQWREEDGKVLTDQLKDTLLQPGESAQVEIILTWINGSDNLGEKVNWAEIYKDENEYNSPDIDSVPGNNEKGEDDIDNAPVLLSTRTGKGPTYILLVLTSVGMISGSVILIKKFVL